MRQRYAERTGQPDRTAEVASHGEGAVNSGMYSGVDSVEDYRVDSGMDAGWILGGTNRVHHAHMNPTTA